MADAPSCSEHRETAHALDFSDEASRWCNRCGWNHTLGEKIGNANGGWGTPSTVRR